MSEENLVDLLKEAEVQKIPVGKSQGAYFFAEEPCTPAPDNVCELISRGPLLLFFYGCGGTKWNAMAIESGPSGCPVDRFTPPEEVLPGIWFSLYKGLPEPCEWLVNFNNTINKDDPPVLRNPPM